MNWVRDQNWGEIKFICPGPGSVIVLKTFRRCIQSLQIHSEEWFARYCCQISTHSVVCCVYVVNTATKRHPIRHSIAILSLHRDHMVMQSSVIHFAASLWWSILKINSFLGSPSYIAADFWYSSHNEPQRYNGINNLLRFNGIVCVQNCMWDDEISMGWKLPFLRHSGEWIRLITVEVYDTRLLI